MKTLRSPPMHCLPLVKYVRNGVGGGGLLSCCLVGAGRGKGGENSTESRIDEPLSLLGGPDPGIPLPHLGSSTLLHCSRIWMRGPGAGLRGRDGSGRLCTRKTKPTPLLSEAQCPPLRDSRVAYSHARRW